MSAKGIENLNAKNVRNYQIYELGRENKETCLLELLPLPSSSLKHWIYSKHSKINFLSNRNDYENYCVKKRINYISSKIKEYQPFSVVFYGIGYEYSWRKIADVEFFPTSEGFFIGRNSHTIFIIAKHPTSFGVTNEYFHNIGKLIAAKLLE